MYRLDRGDTLFKERNLKERHIAEPTRVMRMAMDEDIDKMVDRILLRSQEKEHDLEKRKPKPGWKTKDESLTDISDDSEAPAITIMKPDTTPLFPIEQAAHTSKEHAERIETILRRYQLRR